MPKCRNCGHSYEGTGFDFCSDRCKREYYANNPGAEASDKKWTSISVILFFIIVAFVLLMFLGGGC